MPKKTKRSQEKYPALKPELNLKTRYDLIDYDYVAKLPDKEIPHCGNIHGTCSICNDPKTRFINPRDYLNRFTEEYTVANYEHKGDKVDKTGEDRLVAYGRNNSRNRDIITRQKAYGSLKSIEGLKNLYGLEYVSPEEAMVLEEELMKKLTDPVFLKKIKDRNLVDDLKEYLKDLEFMKKQFQTTKNDPGKS